VTDLTRLELFLQSTTNMIGTPSSHPLDKHVPAGTRAGNSTESLKPLSNGTASSAAPSRPEIGRALNEMDKRDEPILMLLVEMGYPRTEARVALERHDYNL
jgi:hypothetical protein